MGLARPGVNNLESDVVQRSVPLCGAEQQPWESLASRRFSVRCPVRCLGLGAKHPSQTAFRSEVRLVFDRAGSLLEATSLLVLTLAPPLSLRLKEVPLQVGDLQLLKRTREWEVRYLRVTFYTYSESLENTPSAKRIRPVLGNSIHCRISIKACVPFSPTRRIYGRFLARSCHGRKIGLRLLRELVTLDVSYNRLKQWPPQVHECRNLRDLRLNRNKLQEVRERAERPTPETAEHA